MQNLFKLILILLCVNVGSQTAAATTYESLQVEANDGRSSGRSFTGIWLNYNNVDLFHKSPNQIPRISFEFGSDYEKDFYSIGFSERRTPIAFGKDVATISNNPSLGNQFFLHTRNVKSQEFEKFFKRLNAADQAIVTSACAELSSWHRTRAIVHLALGVNRIGDEFRRFWDDDRRVNAITELAKICVNKAAKMGHFSDGFLTEEELLKQLVSSPDKSVDIRSVRTNNWLGNSDPYQSGSVIALVDVNVETHDNGIQTIGNKGILWDGQLDLFGGFTIWGNSPCCPGTIAGLLDGIDKKQFRLDAFNSLTNDLRRTIDASSNESLLLTLHALKNSRKLIAFSLKNSVSRNSNVATIEQYRAHWSKELFSVNPQETISYIENLLAKRYSLSRVNLKRIQTKLKSKGYYGGSIDGLTGPSTLKAIFAFQADNDFYTDGYLSDFEEAVLLRNSPRFESKIVAKVTMPDDDTGMSKNSPAAVGDALNITVLEPDLEIYTVNSTNEKWEALASYSIYSGNINSQVKINGHGYRSSSGRLIYIADQFCPNDTNQDDHMCIDISKFGSSASSTQKFDTYIKQLSSDKLAHLQAFCTKLRYDYGSLLNEIRAKVTTTNNFKSPEIKNFITGLYSNQQGTYERAGRVCLERLEVVYKVQSPMIASQSQAEDTSLAYKYTSLQKSMQRLKSQYEADKAILLDLKGQLQTSQAEVKRLQNLIDKQPTLAQLESEHIKKLTYNLESASKNYKRVASLLQEAQSRNRELEKQISMGTEGADAHSANIEELRQALENSQQKSEIYKANLDSQLTAVKRLEGALVKANNEISKLGSTVILAESENAALQDKLEETTISLSDRKSSWISIKSDLEAEITEYVSNVGELSARLDELTNENQRLNSELRSSVEELDEAKEAKTKTYNALTEAQQTIAFLQNELSQIPALKEKINSLEEALEKAGQAKLIKTWRELAEDDEDWSLWLSDMPIKQILFCDIIAEYNTLLDEALASQNQIRTNLVLKERKLELDGLLPRGELEGWVARVHAVTQTERGDAAVLLELPCSTNVGSGITSLRGEESWAATIPYGDRMYRELVKVGKGDFVIFNASLLEIDEGELGQPEYKFASNLKADKKLPQAFQTDRETFIAIIGYLVEAKR